MQAANSVSLRDASGMDVLTTGADIGTMVTGISALTAAITWTAGRWRERQERLAAIRLRNWHGFVMLEGVDTWYVRLAEDDPGNPSARVVVEVIDPNGQPAPALAVNMRHRADGDGMLSRSPTPEEFDFLKALRKEKGYGKGIMVR